ncbi:MAG TPA: histidine kinase, partial [Solirubrobacterales bacterium]
HGGIVGQPAHSAELDAVSALLAAASALPLLAWRAAPRLVFLATALATVGLAGFGYGIALPLGSAVGLFLYAASRREGDPWAPRGAAEVVGLFIAYVLAAWFAEGAFPDTIALHSGLAWALAWFAGEWTRLRHEHVAELAERASRSERDAERDRLLTVAEERARIARDLHDSAGHAINVIAVRAGGARMRGDAEGSQAALESIEGLARQTAGEIDQMVGSLRWSDRGVDAPPGLASLGALVADYADAGLEVSVASEGEPRPLPGPVDQAAYRILQEALTNAARHGEGGARVDLVFAEEAIELGVTNDSAREISPRANGGHGLIGMRERATLVGGSLEVERSAGSFRLRARLPFQGAAA